MQSNPKKFWHYVKHSRSESLGTPSLRKDNNIYISAEDKAEILSQHFQSVFTQDNGSLPDLGPPLCPGIDNIIFTEPGIRKHLDSLSTCKAAGPDGIPSRILHDLSAEIAETLCFPFQQSYDIGQLPNDWLVAMIVPVYKKDQRSNPANYRPISLTSLVCKVMEHCVLSQAPKHLNANSIITPLQHGFRAGFSCETQLILAVHDWATTLNNHGQVDAIMLDFRKAFDKVSHAKLIHKLEHYGIQGKTRLWPATFLTKRSQFVAVDGSHSSHLEVVSGVPQGTVLGPTLFLLFINDIVDRSDSTIRLFADDAVVYREISFPSDHTCLQYDLRNLQSRAKTWQMQFNVAKCQLLYISNKKPNTSKFDYTLHSQSLTPTDEHDHLGVLCRRDLRWSSHCSKVSSRANKSLGLQRITLKPCCERVKEQAYLSIVLRPIAEYVAPVWSPHTNRDVDKIEQIQKNAARFVKNDYKPYTSTSGLVSSLRWVSLEHRRLLAQASLFYKVRNRLVNISFPPAFRKITAPPDSTSISTSS